MWQMMIYQDECLASLLPPSKVRPYRVPKVPRWATSSYWMGPIQEVPIVEYLLSMFNPTGMAHALQGPEMSQLTLTALAKKGGRITDKLTYRFSRLPYWRGARNVSVWHTWLPFLSRTDICTYRYPCSTLPKVPGKFCNTWLIYFNLMRSLFQIF